MHESDGNRFRNLLRGMGRMYGSDLDGAMLDAYWIALSDWDYADFEAAAKHLMASAKYMPKPADFNALRRSGEPTAAEAWTEALASSVLWRTPEQLPTGRIARAAAAVGGFRAIAMADQERDLPFVQKRFLEAYQQLSDVEPTREALPQIAAYGARVALTGPTKIDRLLPRQLTERAQRTAAAALPGPSEAPAVPKPAPVTKSPREKILALLPLGWDDEAIAKVAGESVDVVRQVRGERECAA